MRAWALTVILGAMAGTSGSCSTPIAAVDIRAAGRIEAGRETHVRIPSVEHSRRIETCLDEGYVRFGETYATVRVDALDLADMDCGTCGLHIGLESSEDESRIDNIRPGYIFGHLLLQAPSDGVLAELRDRCAQWGDSPRYAGACEWQRMPNGTWKSDLFSAQIANGVPDFALVDLEIPTVSEQRIAADRYPPFFQTVRLSFEYYMLATIVAHVFDFSGTVRFVAVAVEVIDTTDGRLLGCLPAVQ
jgi:hypothetical protein